MFVLKSKNSTTIYFTNHNSKDEKKKNIFRSMKLFFLKRRCLTIWTTCRLNFVTLILFAIHQVNKIVHQRLHHHHHLSFHNETWREISIYSSQHPVLYCNCSWQVYSKFTCKFPIRMLIQNIQFSKVTPQTILFIMLSFTLNLWRHTIYLNRTIEIQYTLNVFSKFIQADND